jgi:hypothetical protein
MSLRISYLFFVVFTSLIASIGSATAAPVVWEVADGGNGHAYEAVLASTTWTEANAAATLAGGHLATIHSAAENEFVFNLIDSQPYWIAFNGNGNWGPWIGGLQPPGSTEPAGGWRWVTGEPFSHTNWRSGEPNNEISAGFQENHMQFFSGPGTRANTWNDFFDHPALRVNSYVVEYIPEPASVVLFGLCVLSMLACGCIRRRKAEQDRVVNGQLARRWFMASICTAIVSVSQSTQGQVPFFESFDNPAPPDGRILYAADTVYDAVPGPQTGGIGTGNTSENGYIVQSWESSILNDHRGSGFFLHTRTGGGGGIFTGKVWGTTAPLPVVAGNSYEFAFFLTNENMISNARIQPRINGIDIGPPVSAAGTFLNGGWQRFSVSWSSGVATTADLALVNLQSTGSGNDFGIDDISFIPEPSSILLLGIAGLALLGYARVRGRLRP